jgi:CBS domain-containing protein
VLVVQDGRLVGLISRDQLVEFMKTRAELGI